MDIGKFYKSKGKIMNETYEFCIAGRTRNKEKILEICDIFDEIGVSYYCFLKNEISHKEAGLDMHDNHLADTFETLGLENPRVRTIFEHDLEGEKKSNNFLLVLPAGNSAHIEAGIAYGLGKKCYAIGAYDVTDSLYLIFDEIFKDKQYLREFLEKYTKNLQETDKNPTRNPQEESILEFCNEAKTLKEIIEYFGYKDVANFREQYINPLIADRKLQMTIPNQPNNRNQKYINTSQKFYLKERGN